MSRAVLSRAGLLFILAAPGIGAAQLPAREPGDSTARRIITSAIARRHTMLAELRRCRYAAFVKVAARDPAEPQDSAQSVLLLAEVHSSAYWEYPDRYQETIAARRRWTDAGIGRDLVAVREIVRLSADRIDLEAGTDAARGGGAPRRAGSGRSRDSSIRYSIVSPVAADALDHYGYVLSDSLVVDGRKAFRLTIEPRPDASPLFTGSVDIADSTFDVVGLDLGVTGAVQFPGVTDLRYQEHLRDAGDGRWLPSEVRLTGALRRSISAHWLPKTVAGVRLPEFPRQVAFEETALLSAYTFDDGSRPPDLAEYRTVVRDRADHADSGTWSASGAVPLTDAERATRHASDSLEYHPGLIARLARDADAVQRALLGPGSFHFNRVDGTYLGVAPAWPATPRLAVSTRVGYALGSEVWQYRVGARVTVSSARQLWVGAAYRDETATSRASSCATATCGKRRKTPWRARDFIRRVSRRSPTLPSSTDACGPCQPR
jgi:hypothetical protein